MPQYQQDGERPEISVPLDPRPVESGLGGPQVRNLLALRQDANVSGGSLRWRPVRMRNLTVCRGKLPEV